MSKDIKVKLKKILNKGFRDLGLVLMLFGFLLVAANYETIKYVLSEPKDIMEVIDDTNPVGETVTINIDAIIGNYALIENKINGITTSKQYYYLTWLDNNKYIGLKVSSKNRETMEEICVDTLKYLYGETIDFPEKVQFKGIIKREDNELTGYLKDFLMADDFTESEIQQSCYFYYIDTTCVSDFRFSLVAIGLMLFIVGIILCFTYKSFGGIKKAYNKIIKSGISSSVVDYDIRMGDAFKHIIIGNDIVIVGKTSIVIEKGADLALIYGIVRRNKNISSYSMVLYNVDGVKHDFNCVSNVEFESIIYVMKQKFPNMEVGLNDELGALAKNKQKFKEYFRNKKELNQNLSENKNEAIITERTNPEKSNVDTSDTKIDEY